MAVISDYINLEPGTVVRFTTTMTNIISVRVSGVRDTDRYGHSLEVCVLGEAGRVFAMPQHVVMVAADPVLHENVPLRLSDFRTWRVPDLHSGSCIALDDLHTKGQWFEIAAVEIAYRPHVSAAR